MDKVRVRRAFFALLTFVMVLVLCGCSKPAAKITTQSDFESAMANCLDLSLYAYDPASASYELKDEKLSKSNEVLDFTVDFKSAQPITLPLVLDELEALGWSKADESIHVRYDTYQNAKGEPIIVEVSENFLQRDVVDHYLIIQTYSVGSLKADFTYDLQKRDNAPDFTIAGKVTNQSRMADVVAVLGGPWSASYLEEFSMAKIPAVQLMFGTYEGDRFAGSLMITFSGETEEILEVRYHYAQATNGIR